MQLNLWLVFISLLVCSFWGDRFSSLWPWPGLGKAVCINPSPPFTATPLEGVFSSLFYFVSSFVPLRRGNNLWVKALQSPGKKNHLLPKILTSRGDIHTPLLHWCWFQLTNFNRNNLEVSFSTIPDWNDCSPLVCSRAWTDLLPSSLSGYFFLLSLCASILNQQLAIKQAGPCWSRI